MQAIIMAAGKGSRLGKITENKPKSFIEIENRKLIEYNLELLDKYGIKDIIIVTGYKSEDFEELLKGRPGIRFEFNPFYDTTNVLSSFWFGQDYLKDDFIYMHADTLCDTSIFERLLDSNGEIVLPIDFGKCDEEAMKVRLKDGFVYEINKTMNPLDAAGEFVGIAKIAGNCIPTLKKVTNRIMKEKKFSSFFEVALQEIIDSDKFKVTTVPTDGEFWCEIDFEEDFERAKRNISEELLKL
jgi:L-glutamine-phosphate cytidylyltransferase